MLPPCPFYIIRHGETEANAAQVMAGHTDAQLTAKGVAQAHTARPLIESLPVMPRLIVHSHLSRARDTASIINHGLQLPMMESEDIAEINVGQWEGRPWSEVDVLYQSGEDPPGGETHSGFRARVGRGIAHYCGNYDGPILFVCHGGVMRAVGELYGLRELRFKNCHLHEFEPDAANNHFPWKVWQHDICEASGAFSRVMSEVYHQELRENKVAM